jgi:hypothetical protein
MKIGLLLGAASLVSLLSIGCGTRASPNNYGCGTVAPCGGDVAGDWTATGACTNPYDRVTSGDWCSQLTVDSTGLKIAMLGHDVLAFKKATVSYVADGTFSSQVTFSGPATTQFPSMCLTMFGQIPTCADLATSLAMYLSDQGVATQSYYLTPISQLPQYPPKLAPQPSYSNMDCADDSNGGCSCSYNVDFVFPDKGTYTASGGVLTHYSATEALPYSSDYCVKGSELSMTGHAGTDLMGQIGFRELTLRK